MTYKKKLIEVALPLEAINVASAREKSIRHGHPSTLHLWWARRPLAAARAVIFAQMVDDPSAHPDLFATEKKQEKERQRLFRIVEELVKWENTTNETVLQQARDEIWQSWRYTCAANADHPRARELFDRYKLPAFHDPFAGGGALPLEAQRLGLESYASDLNPVAVLINKAMIEIPPRFAGKPPVHPGQETLSPARGRGQGEGALFAREWKGAQGLAEEVRHYGQWMRDEAEKRIGHLYPKIEVTAAMAESANNPRPDLKKYVGQKLTVIAWPMRTELSNRMIGSGTNALASSIVLVCRQRAAAAPTATRRDFVAALKAELPQALAHLQAGNIAPVDLAQAAIGPGMGVYTRYAKVLDAEGKPLPVRAALALINQTLDEALAEQEGDFDADSRWALTWFDQVGFAEGDFGVANTLAQAKNTGMDGLVEAGIIVSGKGKVRLLQPNEFPADWDPTTDTRLTVWESVHHLVRVLEAGGEPAAAALVAKLGSQAETARELCYRLYILCERKKRATEAMAYNGLVQSWPEITRLARETPRTAKPGTDDLFGGGATS